MDLQFRDQANQSFPLVSLNLYQTRLRHLLKYSSTVHTTCKPRHPVEQISAQFYFWLLVHNSFLNYATVILSNPVRCLLSGFQSFTIPSAYLSTIRVQVPFRSPSFAKSAFHLANYAYICRVYCGVLVPKSIPSMAAFVALLPETSKREICS